MRRLVRVAAGVASAVWLASASADGALAARDAWVREAPPGAAVLAAYLTLENHDTRARQLVAVHGPDFERVEIHATVVRDGVASMVALKTLDIAAHSRVALAPGGYHLMLHRPRRPLAAGDRVRLELHFDSGTRLIVTVPVRRAGGGAAPHH